LLTGGTLALWLILGLPARYFWGDAALVYAGVAVGLCLVPAALTLAWSDWAFRHSPEQQLTMVLGGTGVRLFAVLGGAWALYSLVPYLSQQPGYWAWVFIFYMSTLALEMALILAGRSTSQAPEYLGKLDEGRTVVSGK
jgi:hypothetical protein